MKFGFRTHLIFLALVFYFSLGLPSGERPAGLIEGLGSIAMAQENTTDLPEYNILHTAGPIEVDGRLDESSWKAVAPVDDFIFPWWVEGEKEPHRGPHAVG